MHLGRLVYVPLNMPLRVGQVASSNNQIVIATSDQALRLNMEFNVSDAPPDVTNDTGGMGLAKPQESQPGLPLLQTTHRSRKTMQTSMIMKRPP